MTWTYLGVPGTTSADSRRDAVRYLIKDTVSTRQLVQDEELDFLLSQNGNNVWRSAADACEQLSAREAKSKSVGDLSLSGMGESYCELAARYRMRANSLVSPFAGGITISDKDIRAQDTDRVQPAFSRSLHGTPGLDTNTTGST